MCDKCIHKLVCSRFVATGGNVKACEYWKSEKLQEDNERLKAMLDNAYEIIGKMTDRWG